MAPGSANKRKRPDRQFSHDDGGRPSPHRPENQGMAQRMERPDGARSRGERGSRRQSRQGGPADGVNAVPVVPRNALSPPTPQAQAAQQVSTPGAEISRTNTPVPRVATPAEQPREQKPPDPPAPYAYEYLTDECVASWQERGKLGIVENAKQADEMIMGTIFQELVRSALDGRLDPGEAGAVMKRLVSERQRDDVLAIQSSFLSTVSMLDDGDTRNPALLSLLAATNIDPEVLRQYLDVPVLTALSLVRSTFDRMRARKTTNLLYRQANYNLFREETEGYAKLLTEYFNIAEEANKIPSSDIAENAFHRIMALVGAFDLDVGRVLDITLDISANLLVKAYAFFIKFYRCSSWWPEGGNLDNVKWEDDGFNTFPSWALPGSGRLGPSEDEKSKLASAKQLRDEHFWKGVREKGITAFFELGTRRIVDYESVAEQLAVDSQPELDSKGKELTEDRRKRLNESRKYMRETRTLPAPGNSDAAQLLGFKLRFYASPARDADDIMPENLIHFAALLIKVGFISLRDLYPHLHPADDRMPEERARLEKEKVEKEAKDRPGGGPNKLATASALTDDTLPFSSRSRTDKGRSGGATPKPESKEDTATEELPPPPNQKIGLLKALLALGAIPESMYILGRFPWLVEVDSLLPPYLRRIVRHMLSGIAETVRPLAGREGLTEGREQLADLVAKPDGTLSYAPRPPKLPTKWLGLEEVSDKDGSRYRYYYTEWADNVPVCQSLDDVFQLCNTLVGFLGVKIGQETAILGTLVRLAKKSLVEDGSEANKTRWLEQMRRLLVPALSLSKHNISLTDDMHQLLMMYPVMTRYNMYAEWLTGKTSRLPDMKVAFEHNRAEVKDVLRRVSNENVKVQSRALGKVSYSSPGVLMMFMISQLESYTNMIPALVECTKYFPRLAYDVLTWCLINSLSGQGRDRIQADGMLTSSWLQALSQFVAALFYHYSSVNPSPILQYLASELRNGDSTDLEMFEQVLMEMAGIRSGTEFNDAQVQAMAGGEHLQAHIMQQLADVRHARKSQAKRLMKALTEPGLIGQMLIAIAQEKQMYSHHESSQFMPLKVLGNNLDKIQSVFAQYLDVLKTNLKPDEFEAAVPDVVTLVGDFGLQPGVAFTICRAVLAHRMHDNDESRRQEELQLKKRRASQEKAQANGDVDMQEADAKPAPNTERSIEDKPIVNGDDLEQASMEVERKPSATPLPNGIASRPRSPWHPVLEPIIQRLHAVSGDLQDRVSVPFFVTFWTLALHDVVVPTESYGLEINKITAQVAQLNRDRATLPSSGRLEIERKKKAIQDVQAKLRSEVKARVGSYTRVTNRLSQREKQHWFDRSRKREDLDRRHLALLQECFLPRAMASSLDAQYSYVMLRMLHDKGTPGFSTLVMIQQLLRKQALAALIFQCTGQEAQHFGRFLNEVLKMIAGWHTKKEDFELQALGKQKLPGFVIGPMDYNASAETWKFLDYESFRRLDSDWHHAIHGALMACFESGEYMHIRNGIVVLKAVVGVYPQLEFQGKQFVSAMEKLSAQETRQDLKLMALSLLGPLKSREKQWVMVQAFRLNDPSKGAKPASRAPSARPETPQPSVGTPKLNAGAAEFKPSNPGLPNGTSRKESVAGIEDGEVEEENQAAAKSADTKMEVAPAAKVEVKPAAPAEPQQSEARPQSKPESEPKAAPLAPAKDQLRPASQPPTPAPSAPRGPPSLNGTPRHDSSRPPPASREAPRGSQGLPPRPESRAEYANKPLPPPPVARPDGRYPRRGDDGYGRLGHPGDGRPSSREHSPGSRSRTRTPPGMLRSHPRDERPRPGREEHWASSRRDAPAAAMHTRPQDARDRMNGSMGPPPAHGAAPPRPGHLNSVVSAAATQPPSGPASSEPTAPQASAEDTQFRVNTERQRLIEEANRASGTHQPQQQNVPKSQPPPETRRERDPRDERDMRPDGQIQSAEPPREPQSRRDQSTDLAPSGPRKGRLSRDIGREESSYGRLNAPSEPPSGPRPMNGHGGRGGRNFNGPQPSVNTRPNDPPLQSPTAPRPPESPAGFRQQQQQQPLRQPSFDRHNSGAQIDQQRQPPPPPPPPPTTSLPPTPTDDLAGMNPERLKLFTNVAPSNAGQTQYSPTSAPPSGPRGAAGRPPVNAPTGPSPVSAVPPSGPASAVDRQRGSRQRGLINQALQSATAAQGPRGQDVSFRGASSRQNSFNMSSATVAPPVQAIASPMEPPARRNDGPPRNDGPQSRPESRTEPRQDLFQQSQRTEPRNDSRARYRKEEPPRGSRHASRERRPDDEPPRRPPPPGMDDGRDNRGLPRDDRRARDDRDPASCDRRGGPRPDDSRRPPLDMQGSMPGPPPPGYPQNNYGHDSRRDGPDDGRRGGRDDGRQEDYRGPRREDERRDGSGRGMGRDDVHPDRKRRHEEPPFDPMKRRRSGR